ncbi:MAG: site-specific DNA-methyltransferase, partial [bacterium]
YMNNYHYNRNTRPQLYWLGYVQEPRDLGKLEWASFGKYWQTVREARDVQLSFDPPSDGLCDTLAQLRSLNAHKGVYGGRGWANYAATYLNDCHVFAQGIRFVLRRGGTALVVIGNSILQGVCIPTDRYFGEIAQAVGLQLVDIHIPRATRVGNSIVNSGVRVGKPHRSSQLYEAIVELRKC